MAEFKTITFQVNTSTGEIVGEVFENNYSEFEKSKIKDEPKRLFGTLYYNKFITPFFKSLTRAEQNLVIALMVKESWQNNTFLRKNKEISKLTCSSIRTVERVIPKLINNKWIVPIDGRKHKYYMLDPMIWSRTTHNKSGSGRDYRYGQEQKFENNGGNICDSKNQPFASVYLDWLLNLTEIKGNNVINFMMYLISNMNLSNRIKSRNHDELKTDENGRKFGMARKEFSKMVNSLLRSGYIARTLDGYMVNPDFASKTSIENQENLYREFYEIAIRKMEE